MSSDPVAGGIDFRAVIEPLARRRGWLVFAAVLMFIGGGLYAITIVGLVIAWLPIWLGVLFIKSANAFRDAMATADAERGHAAIQALATILLIWGISTIVLMAIYGIVLALMVTGAISGFTIPTTSM
ncbi:MAG TPA: DUF5362 family protein [Planctomycetota bacterium]|nr:DUF5362 family protein [Planctomycetota bacterium]